MKLILRSFILICVILLVSAGSAHAAVITPAYTGNYSIIFDDSVPDLPTPYGGVTFLAGNANTLLIGGNANNSSGAIYSIGVVRNVGGHITGFSGTASLFATAPNIDGGLAYGPGGVLFYTTYSNNLLGQIKPGSTSPDRTDNLTVSGVFPSTGTLQFVPAGFPGAGGFKIASYSGGQFYDATLTPDGNGTYNISAVTQTFTGLNGPEGIAYVPLGSPLFTNASMLVSEYQANRVVAYELDGDGNPTGSSSVFITGLFGAEGAAIDPVTGDFLFSTFGVENRLVIVSGFLAPEAAVPEPASMLIWGLGAVGCAVAARRRRKLV